MKKISIILASAILLGCNSRDPIDQNVKDESFEQDLDQFRQLPEYDALVFDRAVYMHEDGMGKNKTFRELLNEAKEINNKFDDAWQKFENDKKEFTKLLAIDVQDGFVVDVSEDSDENPFGYSFSYIISNNSDKNIMGYRGDLLFLINDDTYILKVILEDEAELPPGSERPVHEVVLITDADDLMALQNTSFEKLMPLWEPTRIVFDDGSTLEAIPPQANFSEYHKTMRK